MIETQPHERGGLVKTLGWLRESGGIRLCFPLLLGGSLTAQSFFLPPDLSGSVPIPPALVDEVRSGRSPQLADVTGDGIKDLIWSDAFTGSSADQIVVQPLDATGAGASFITSPHSFILEGGVPVTVDINGDGLADLLRSSANGVRTMIALGDGTFSLDQFNLPPFSPQRAFVIDMDALIGDEVVVYGANSDPMAGTTLPPTFAIYRRVAGQLVLATNFTVPLLHRPSGEQAIAIGDFDGNGLKDIAYGTRGNTPNTTPLSIRVLRQVSPLSFTDVGPFPLPTPNPSCACTIAVVSAWSRDLNWDGRDDLILAGNQESLPFNGSGPLTAGHFTVLSGNSTSVLGTGTLTIPYPAAICEGNNIPPSDFDGDGVLELSARFYTPGVQGTLQADLFRRVPGQSGIAKMLVAPISAYYSALFPNASPDSWTIADDPDGDGDLDILFVATTYEGGVWHLRKGWTENTSIYRSACSPGGTTLVSGHGVAAPGNSQFGFSIAGAPPAAPAALVLSLATNPWTIGGCSLWLDLNPPFLIWPSGASGTLITNASGAGFLPLPLPNSQLLVGASALTQWVVVDPAGSFVTPVSNFSLSDAQRVMIW